MEFKNLIGMRAKLVRRKKKKKREDEYSPFPMLVPSSMGTPRGYQAGTADMGGSQMGPGSGKDNLRPCCIFPDRIISFSEVGSLASS